jgi:hypothetical protein
MGDVTPSPRRRQNGYGASATQPSPVKGEGEEVFINVYFRGFHKNFLEYPAEESLQIFPFGVT